MCNFFNALHSWPWHFLTELNTTSPSPFQYVLVFFKGVGRQDNHNPDIMFLTDLFKTSWKKGFLKSQYTFGWRKSHLYSDFYLAAIYIGISTAAAAAAKLLQSCPTLCDPIDGSTPGSPVPGILQARTLEWVAMSFSNAGKWKVKVKSLSHIRLLATPWTAAYQAPLSMGFSRQEYWSGVPVFLLGFVKDRFWAWSSHLTARVKSLSKRESELDSWSRLQKSHTISAPSNKK